MKNQNDVYTELCRIVAEKGHQYVYSNKQTPRDPGSIGLSARCFYRNPDIAEGVRSTTRCIVGEVHFRLFGEEFPHPTHSDGAIGGPNINGSAIVKQGGYYTRGAIKMLSLVQLTQDYGAAWGICVALADRYRALHPEEA